MAAFREFRVFRFVGRGAGRAQNRKTRNLRPPLESSGSSDFEPAPTQLKYRNCKQEHDIRGPFLRSCLLRGCFPSRLPPPRLPSGMPPRNSESSDVPVRRRAGRTIERLLTRKAAPHFKSVPIFRRGVGGDTFRQSPIATRPARNKTKTQK